MSDGPIRGSIDLDGTWEFVTDPTESGVEDGWADPSAEWPDRARTVAVPVAWEELAEFRDYAGRAWYRRSFEVASDALADRDAILRFDAVDYETTVWLNGERVGRNRGGYLPFEFDATDAVEPGENVLVAAVTDPADLSEIPHGKQGDPWYTRVSGIWQSVRLDLRPRTRVAGARVTPDLPTDTATVEIDVRSTGRALDALTCDVRAFAGDGAVVAAATTAAKPSTEVVLEFDDPAYWHPDDPVCYDVEVELRDGGDVVDRYADYFGFRSFETDGRRFLLNGEPITMRGVLEQGYYPDTLYRPPGDDTFEAEVTVAKELGFNLVRKHIKPAHPDFLECADRLGILVWEEPANPTLYTDASREAVRDQALAMVERDYNRPSVVVWSLYNEEWGFGHADNEETLWTDETKQRYLADLYRDVRERDPTRLVCDNSGWAHVATDVNDFHRYFVSPDRAETWAADLDYIRHHPGDNYATRAFDETDAPIVLSELGTWGLCDVPALRAHYGGEPPWFAHDFLTEELKRPAGLDERFAASDLPEAFGDYAALADAWQRREYVSVKHILEEVRTREDVAGYVLTELSDIEWEFNGLLDYRRERKNFHDEFATVNAPVAVVAGLDRHVRWDGETCSVDVSVVNDTGEALTGTVACSLCGAAETASLSVPARGVGRLSDPIVLPVTAEEAVARERLAVTFRADGLTVSTTEPVTAVPRGLSPTPDATVFAEGAFASRLARRDVSVTHDLGRASLAVTDRFTDEVDAFAAEGGAVVHVPGPDGHVGEGGPFAYHRVPERESWIEAASFLYQHSRLLADLCDSPRLGWAFEGLYPFTVATDLDPDEDEIHAGYVEGWLGNWGSPLVTRAYGRGSVTALTFRVRDRYADHPAATLIVDRLLSKLASASQ